MALKFASLVAKNLKALRAERGLTALEAATLCEVSERTWYYYEFGHETSTGAAVGGSLDKIAAAFKVPLSRLLQVRQGRQRETKSDAKRTRRFARKS